MHESSSEYMLAKVWDRLRLRWWVAPSGKELWLNSSNAARALACHIPSWREQGYQIVSQSVTFNPPING